MHRTTLISVEELAHGLRQCVVVDCRHDLGDPRAGRLAWQSSHIPGAHFLHMDEDLSGPRQPGSGRHPLPEPGRLRAALGALGIGADTQLVAYDAAGGACAARLWWLARWLGHERAAVLDGGWPAWLAAGHAVDSEVPVAPGGPALPHRPPRVAAVDADTLLRGLPARHHLIVDARGRERYLGLAEPLDPVAGHIPGSVNRPFQANLAPDGRFKPPALLREEWLARLAGQPLERVVHSCGSGVSACHNLLAMEAAGLGGTCLYPGSWSEWCADRSRPVATGDEPR